MFFEWAFLSCLVNIQLFRNFGFFYVWIWIFQFGKQQKQDKKQAQDVKKLRIMGKFRYFFIYFFRAER